MQPAETFPGVKVVSGPLVSSTRVSTEYQVASMAPSYSYGKATPGTWSAVEPSTDIMVGDVVRFTYRLRIPFLEEWQSKFIIGRLAADGRFALRYYALNEEISRLIVEVEIVKAGTPALAIGLAIAAVVAGGLIFLTVHSIEKLGRVKVGPFEANLGGIITLGILAVVGIGLYRRT